MPTDGRPDCSSKIRGCGTLRSVESTARRGCACRFAHELLRLGPGGPRVEPALRGGLAGWRQRVVANYIEEHVADELPLATMAQLARLSPYHFSRAFKQTFGI